MKVRRFLFVAIAFALCSCKHGQASATQSVAQPTDSVKPFVWPEIPSMFTTRQQKLDYVSANFWQNFNFADTAYVHHPEVTEQAWSDYMAILQSLDPDVAAPLIKKTMEQSAVSKTMYDYFVSLADKYLYDANSPARNEDLYIAVLEQMVNGHMLSDADKIRPNYRLKLARRNRVGDKATDFKYTLADGKQGSLYGIQSPYTLIFFNNPGCHACAEYITALKTSPVILKHLRDKTLTILALYPDENLDEWFDHQKDIPSAWINSYDKGTVLQSKALYDLKAIPCLYLLDGKKIVLLKDAQIDAVVDFLKGR